jgi:hypothetical protein
MKNSFIENGSVADPELRSPSALAQGLSVATHPAAFN